MVQQKKFEQTFINEYMAINLHEYDVEQRGIKKGIEIGEKQKAQKLAIAFLKSGVSLETVADCTDLSIDYLKTLV